MISLTEKLRASHQRTSLCRFDDGDIHTQSRKAMTTMMAKHFPELRNMSELDSRISSDVKEYESELRESDS